MKKNRQGVREFDCECGHQWYEETRDCYSPSASTCPKCNDLCFPIGCEQKDSVKVDKFGNLVEKL